MPFAILGVIVAVVVLFLAAIAWQVRRRNMQRWLPSYFRERERYQPVKLDREIHVLLCMADHYEPKAGGADVATGMQRVAAWVEKFPQQFGKFKDSDGRPPRYTFFFPAEEYEKEYLDALAQLCKAGFGEVELHLHHDNDTAANFRATLLRFRDLLVKEHGLLARHKETGAIQYGFIHGNWALCNSRPDGRQCGVNEELAILLETGCYADFTFPSAPDITQPPLINRIYFASDRPGQPASHEVAVPAGPNTLLMVQGPLLLDWTKKKWGFFPGIENGCLQSTQPPSIERLWLWLQAHIQVAERPDWFFIKLHAHGAPEYDHEPLLGEPMVRFHESLARLRAENPNFHFHYVTAREMVNLIRAAQAGFKGPVAEALDWELVSNLQTSL
jgi:hypothetical protein